MGYRFLFIFLVILMFALISGCNDDNPVDGGSAAYYPFIAITDETGQVIGGTTDDWCWDYSATNPPNEFMLYPAYPNPFNGTTIIRFALPEMTYVRITLQNDRWRLAFTIMDNYIPAGLHTLEWSSGDLPCGYYECYMTAGNFQCQGTLMVLR
ncbi:MAG: hypothetical protein AB1483_03035 [Candidatus Zixiibacteriota bacterium]